MGTYQLTLDFTQENLEALQQAGYQIVVQKPVAGGGAESNLAWMNFMPYYNNVITWEENYQFYVSNHDTLSPSPVVSGIHPPAMQKEASTLANPQVILLMQNPPQEATTFELPDDLGWVKFDPEHLQTAILNPETGAIEPQ
ncbi:hypothetical protein [Deinococcus misasensis]|uniref:hypothetical protein n=1 Tax=Deinococcus misasensis TaxID=392413 RepID=UPI00054DBF19|nr:hypothetical protein [Deinococcus misasensis]